MEFMGHPLRPLSMAFSYYWSLSSRIKVECQSNLKFLFIVLFYSKLYCTWVTIVGIWNSYDNCGISICCRPRNLGYNDFTEDD